MEMSICPGDSLEKVGMITGAVVGVSTPEVVTHYRYIQGRWNSFSRPWAFTFLLLVNLRWLPPEAS